jgi:outer membrane protein assembly factor BamD
MNGLSFRMRHLQIAALGFALTGAMCTGAIAQKKVHVTKVKPKPKTDTSQTAEPDKVLYDRAMESLKKTKFIEARLDLQTLINTYPDSEYLAKAKLAIADSYYKEGGTSNLTQAVDEYKNFIVFFPFLDEAAYAQMQVAMCHYRMMEKSDRDNSQAEAAEDEFRTFLLKFPQSPLIGNAEQNLRNVQEVLADGEFKIAHFYYAKPDYRASAARLVELTGRYPLYSQSDLALSMLGDIYMRAKQASKNEDDKNHWGDLAGQCYSRIVKDYPLSRLAPDAKEKLTSMGMAVPKADPDALARMQKQQLFEKEHRPNMVTSMPMNMIRSSPDVHLASHVGQPNLNPPDDTVSATEVLNQGAAGPSFGISASRVSGGGGNETAPSDTESVSSSDSSSTSSDSSAPTATTPAVQILDAPGATPTATAPTAAPSTMTTLPVDARSSETTTENSAAPAATQPEATAAPAANATVVTPPAGASQAVANSSSSSGTTTQASGQNTNQSSSSKDDAKSESSSKKKKGLHKLIP